MILHDDHIFNSLAGWDDGKCLYEAGGMKEERRQNERETHTERKKISQDENDEKREGKEERSTDGHHHSLQWLAEWEASTCLYEAGGMKQ